MLPPLTDEVLSELHKFTATGGRGLDEYPPQIEYPEGHRPMCPRTCAHDCHKPYDEWKARQPC